METVVSNSNTERSHPDHTAALASLVVDPALYYLSDHDGRPCGQLKVKDTSGQIVVFLFRQGDVTPCAYSLPSFQPDRQPVHWNADEARRLWLDLGNDDALVFKGAVGKEAFEYFVADRRSKLHKLIRKLTNITRGSKAVREVPVFTPLDVTTKIKGGRK